jgi:hypothetical protein
MNVRAATAIAVAVTVVATRVAGRGQTGTAEYSRKSDVIYGRKMGLALTLELFTPVHPNGLGVVSQRLIDRLKART